MIFSGVAAGSIGFGVYLIIGPALWILFGPTEAIASAFITGLAPATLLIPLKKEIDFDQVRIISLYSLPALLAGILLHLFLMREVLYILAGLVIIFLILISKFIKQISPKVAGLTSGALTTSVGFNGPPISLSFQGKDERVQRASVISCLLFFNLISAPIFLTVSAEKFLFGISIGLILFPFILFGVFLGNTLAHKIGNKIEIIALIVSLSGALFLITKSFY